MALPSVSINFKVAAEDTARRATHGVVGLILKESKLSTPLVITDEADIPATMTAANKEQIKLALKGYDDDHRVRKVVVEYADKGETVSYDMAFTHLLASDVDYLAIPSVVEDKMTDAVVTWLKEVRDTEKISTIAAVLPNTGADYEGVIDFAENEITADGTTYDAAGYCARIAGILATTPAYASATYAVLPEITGIGSIRKKADISADIDAGKLVLYWDGEKVKIARAVNSLVTVTEDKPEVWKRIKSVRVMDLIEYDIRKLCEDNYIGRKANTYDNKTLLVSDINGYLDGLKESSVIADGKCDIDIAGNRTYLKDNGTDVSKLTDTQIRQALTGDEVFLAATLKLMDAIEDITLNISL